MKQGGYNYFLKTELNEFTDQNAMILKLLQNEKRGLSLRGIQDNFYGIGEKNLKNVLTQLVINKLVHKTAIGPGYRYFIPELSLRNQLLETLNNNNSFRLKELKKTLNWVGKKNVEIELQSLIQEGLVHTLTKNSVIEYTTSIKVLERLSILEDLILSILVLEQDGLRFRIIKNNISEFSEPEIKLLLTKMVDNNKLIVVKGKSKGIRYLHPKFTERHNYKSKVLQLLSKHPQGLGYSSIANRIKNLSRNSAENLLKKLENEEMVIKIDYPSMRRYFHAKFNFENQIIKILNDNQEGIPYQSISNHLSGIGDDQTKILLNSMVEKNILSKYKFGSGERYFIPVEIPFKTELKKGKYLDCISTIKLGSSAYSILADIILERLYYEIVEIFLDEFNRSKDLYKVLIKFINNENFLNYYCDELRNKFVIKNSFEIIADFFSYLRELNVIDANNNLSLSFINDFLYIKQKYSVKYNEINIHVISKYLFPLIYSNLSRYWHQFVKKLIDKHSFNENILLKNGIFYFPGIKLKNLKFESYPQILVNVNSILKLFFEYYELGNEKELPAKIAYDLSKIFGSSHLTFNSWLKNYHFPIYQSTFGNNKFRDDLQLLIFIIITIYCDIGKNKFSLVDDEKILTLANSMLSQIVSSFFKKKKLSFLLANLSHNNRKKTEIIFCSLIENESFNTKFNYAELISKIDLRKRTSFHPNWSIYVEGWVIKLNNIVGFNLSLISDVLAVSGLNNPRKGTRGFGDEFLLKTVQIEDKILKTTEKFSKVVKMGKLGFFGWYMDYGWINLHNLYPEQVSRHLGIISPLETIGLDKNHRNLKSIKNKIMSRLKIQGDIFDHFKITNRNHIITIKDIIIELVDQITEYFSKVSVERYFDNYGEILNIRNSIIIKVNDYNFSCIYNFIKKLDPINKPTHKKKFQEFLTKFLGWTPRKDIQFFIGKSPIYYLTDFYLLYSGIFNIVKGVASKDKQFIDLFTFKL